MRFAELAPDVVAARWHSLSLADQEKIGTKVMLWLFAELVSQDDGLDTTKAEREQAGDISDRCLNDIDKVVEPMFPDVCWAWPDGFFYEVADRTGSVVGRIECLIGQGYQFVATTGQRGELVHWEGIPYDAIPGWARTAIEQGGRWYAVSPNPAELNAAA